MLNQENQLQLLDLRAAARALSLVNDVPLSIRITMIYPLVALFQRLYNTTKGQVLLDNYNVRSINPGYLRRVLVSVSQEPTLLSFTIRENIAYGLPDDEASMEKIIEAAKVIMVFLNLRANHRGAS